MIKEQDSTHLSQVDSSNTYKTPVVEEIQVEKVTPVQGRKKKRRKKEKRQERLLNYQEKLVKSSGLPQSRLMEKKRPEQDQFSVVRKNLSHEFGQVARVR